MLLDKQDHNRRSKFSEQEYFFLSVHKHIYIKGMSFYCSVQRRAFISSLTIISFSLCSFHRIQTKVDTTELYKHTLASCSEITEILDIKCIKYLPEIHACSNPSPFGTKQIISCISRRQFIDSHSLSNG